MTIQNSYATASGLKTNSFTRKKIMKKVTRNKIPEVFSFVASCSILFQGCCRVLQWNDEANKEEGFKVLTKCLVRFHRTSTRIIHGMDTIQTMAITCLV